MGTEKPASALSSIRTFSSDLARSQKTTPSTAVSKEPSVPAAPSLAVVGNGESRTYQAPTWKKAPPPPANTLKKKPAVVPPPSTATPTTLKPLTGPKRVEETTIVVDNEDAASAVIIRDTKHDRFNLLTAITASLKAWFAGITEQYFTKKPPKYTVPETTRRKGVIQKATSKTGKLATFDGASLQARIKERATAAAPKEPTTIWTANTEPGYPLLEAPETTPAISNVRVVPRKSFRTEAPLENPVVPAVTVPKVTVSQPRIIIASETEPIIDSTPPPAVSAPEPVPTVEIPATPTPVLQPAPVVSQPTSLQEWIFAVNTNLVAIALAGFVLLVVVIAVSSYSWFTENINTLEVATTPNHRTYLDAPLQTITTEATRELVFENLITNQKNSGGRLLLFAFTTTASGEILVPPQTLMSTLNFSVSTPFARSLNALYFGVTETQAPFVLLKTTDNNTALGGMLNWEDSLYRDLLPLLAAQEADRATHETTETFKDILIDNKDARVLLSSTGKTLLVYNQPINNTIIITTTQQSLSALILLIQ